MRRRVKELFTDPEDEYQNWTHYEQKDKNKCITIKSKFIQNKHLINAL